MNKKGIEISINFVVMLIMGIVVFSMGLVFLKMINKESTGIQQDIEKETIHELEKIFEDGSKVAIPKNAKTIETGESETFAIGIMNILGQKSDFSISATPGKAYTPAKVEITTGKPTVASPTDISGPLTLENNEYAAKRIMVIVPGNAVPGRYIINVDVTCTPGCSGTYDGYRHKIYVDVK